MKHLILLEIYLKVGRFLVKRKIKKGSDFEIAPFETVSFDEQFKDDYVEFGTYVAEQRALPDVRDGLKPVARRILFLMKRNGYTSDKPYKKSARIVGIVMGELHPHGDTSIYEAMVRMSKNWINPLLFVDFKGNRGNRRGDGPAAQRYTEARMSLLCENLLSKLNSASVTYVPNYSDEFLEPVALPFLIPNLLINGNDSIAVGFISRIPQHNPLEVIEAYKLFLKRKKICVEDLLEVMPGPDFPTGGEVFDLENLYNFYKTGVDTKMMVRGKTEIDGNSVIITELPYNIVSNIDAYFEKLLDSVLDGVITNASSCKNRTTHKGVKIIVNAKDGCDPKDLEAELYAKTPLQSSTPLRFNVLRNGIPTRLDLLEYFNEVKEFGISVIKNDSVYQLEKISKSIRLKTGLLSALDQIDIIIELIKNSKKKSDIISGLTKGDVQEKQFKTKKSFLQAKKLNFTEEQAEEIVRIPLGRLSSLSRIQMEDELKKLQAEYSKLNKIIESKDEQKKVLLQEITKIEKFLKSTFNFERNTKLTKSGLISYKDKEIISKSIVSIDKFGYLRNLSVNSSEANQEIFRKESLSNQDIFFFTNKGRLCRIKISDLGIQTLKNKGQTLSSILKLDPSEYPILKQESILVASRTEELEGKYFFVSSDGMIKMVSKNDIPAIKKISTGTKLKSGSELIFSGDIEGKTKAVLITEGGMFKTISISDVPTLTKNTIGVQSGKLGDDKIVSVELVDDKDELLILDKKIKAKTLKIDRLTTKYKKI